MTAVVYSGRIEERADGEYDDAVWIGEDRYLAFAAQFQEDVNKHGRYVTVRYHVADGPRTEGELRDAEIAAAIGEADVEYQSHYSEYTGWLWTDESCVVGGHDLLAELRSHVGRWCHITVTFSKEPR